MYRITLACLSVPTQLGEAGAADIQQEFAKRPWHENVRCMWDGEELLLHADSDWDVDGKALVDEFSDSISACIDDTFDGEIEIRSISPAPDGA